MRVWGFRFYIGFRVLEGGLHVAEFMVYNRFWLHGSGFCFFWGGGGGLRSAVLPLIGLVVDGALGELRGVPTFMCSCLRAEWFVRVRLTRVDPG